MSITIQDVFEKNSRIRITYCNGVATVKWPIGSDPDSENRRKKIHSAIKRCHEHDEDFAEHNLHLKSNMQVSRLDKFDYIDLRWTATELGDEVD